MARLLSTTIFLVLVGYLFLVYTNLTINPLNIIVREQVDWRNVSRLELIAPKVFSEKPGILLPQYKNPCWRGPKHTLLCLPYFYLAGMPKCGTTDLWRKVIEHPLISAQSSKEPHWWTRRRFGHNVNEPVSTYQYYSRMSQALKKASRVSGISKNKIIVGDGSASTLWDNRRWTMIYPKHQEGPPHIIAEVIASVQPDAKFIVILRNPTERLYSDYLFFANTSMPTSPNIFHRKLMRSLDKWNQCTSNHERRTCTYGTTHSTWNTINDVRINIGMYSVYIADWLKVFPKDRMVVYRMEDWRDNCRKVLRTIYEFLDLHPLPSEQLHGICNKERANALPSDKKHIGPMWNKTRTILNQFYEPFNQELAGLLNDDRFLWR